MSTTPRTTSVQGSGGGGGVTSVNGDAGPAVVLTAAEVGAVDTTDTTATPTASKIPIANADATLDDWLSFPPELAFSGWGV